MLSLGRHIVLRNVGSLVRLLCLLPYKNELREKIQMTDVVELPLLDKTISKIERVVPDPSPWGDNFFFVFHCNDGTSYGLTHHQDCCEEVWLEDIEGDLDDLIGSPILKAEHVTDEVEKKEDYTGDEYLDDYSQWTFYKLATIKGSVDLRFMGTSNGYYGVEVDFEEYKSQ